MRSKNDTFFMINKHVEMVDEDPILEHVVGIAETEVRKYESLYPSIYPSMNLQLAVVCMCK